MAQDNLMTNETIHRTSLIKCMVIGGGIALLLISVFLLPVGEPKPEWPRFWYIRPLIVVPLAGATGGVFYFLMDYFRSQGGWKKVLANTVSFFVYVFGLWIGTVLGLVGTLWN